MSPLGSWSFRALKSASRSKTRRSAAARPPRRFIPGFDPLEDRRLLAVDLNGTFLKLGIDSNGALIDDTKTTGAVFSGTDFITPGTPIAYFTVAANGSFLTNNGAASGTAFPVTVTDTSSGTVHSVLITGTPVAGLSLTRKISFDDNAWSAAGGVVRFDTTLTNTSLAAIPAVGLVEGADPDQDAPTTFATNNDIVPINGNNFNYVRATGAATGLVVGFGSADARSGVTVSAAGSTNPFLIIAAPNDPNGALSDDQIEQAFNFGALAVGQSASATHYMSFAPSNALSDAFMTAALGKLTYTAPAGASLTLHKNGTSVEIVDNTTGQVVAQQLASLTNAISITGAAGAADTLTVDFTGGNPVPTNGLNFDGGAGAGANLLNLKGGTFTSETYNATGPHAGNISINGGTSVITYSNLTPMNDTAVSPTLVFNTPAGGNDIVNIVNGPIVGGSQTTQINSGNALFELLNFANKTAVTVNSLDGIDTINVGYTIPAAALTSLRVDTGEQTNAASDTVNVTATPAAVSMLVTNTSILGGLNDQVNIGTGSTQSILGAINVTNPGNGTDLFVNDTADVTARTATFNLAAGVGSITGTMLPGGLTFSESDINGITVSGGSGGNTYQVNASLSSSVRFTTINAGAGNDTITLNGATNQNRVFLNGQAGDDIFNVTASLALPPSRSITVDGGTNTGVGDVLNFNAQSTPGTPVDVLMTATQIFATGYQVVNYGNLEFGNLTNLRNLEVDGDGSANNLTLTRASAANNAFTLDTGPFVTFPTTANSFDFEGMAGNDTMAVNESAFGLPSVAGTAPLAHTNASFIASALTPQTVGFNFTGGANSDSMSFNFLTSQNAAYFSDTVGAANSGVVNIATKLAISFVSLAPLTFVGAGGTITMDATSTPTTTLTMSDAPGVGTTQVAGDGGFETTTFSGFANAIVRGGTGAQTITLASADGALPANPGAAALTSITLDGDNTTNNDAADDIINVQSLPAGVTATLLSGASGVSGDTFNLDNPSHNLTGNIFGQVIVSPAADNAGTKALMIDNSGDPAANTVTFTATSIEGITGFAGTPDVIYDAGQLIQTVRMLTSNVGADTVNVQSTHLNTASSIVTGGGGDTVNVSSNAPTNTGDLLGIKGNLFVFTGAGADTLNVSALGDVAGDTYGLTGGLLSTLTFTRNGVPGAAINYDNGLLGQLENFNLTGSSIGANTYNINNTTATVSSTISDGTPVTSGAATFNIQADAVQAGAANTFNGNAGVDTFNVNFAAGLSVPTAAGTTFAINGGLNGADSNNRDLVNLNANQVGDGARAVNLAYQSHASGDVNVAGLGGVVGTGLVLTAVEQVNYTGDAANNDALTVTGTATANDLTLAPLTPNSTLAFLGDPTTGNGIGWDGPGSPNSFANTLPGVAGGSTGPDLLLKGLANSGIAVAGGTANNSKLHVYATSESSIVDPATIGDPFGFGLGPGVIIPGVGVGNAYDKITVTDTQVSIVRNQGAGPALLPVNIQPNSGFNQTNPLNLGLIVNAGDEALPGPGGVADNITATASTHFKIQVNGGNPLPSFAPQGDQLNVIATGDINVFNDNASPPNFTVQTGSNLGVGFSSIERAIFTAGPSQTVNFFGDGNAAGTAQTDNVVIKGTGPNQFDATVNGSAALSFQNVAFLHVSRDQTPKLPTSSDVDRLEIQPYADNTPRGWGVATTWDEGGPTPDATDPTDLLVYDGVPGVSDQIVISPSGPGTGQVAAVNAVTGTPIAVINYTSNTAISVAGNDGSLGDTDTLTLKGTDGAPPLVSGNDTFNVDFSAAGTTANPMVRVSDSNNANVLYQLNNLTNIQTVNLAMGDGNDTMNLLGSTLTTGFPSGVKVVNVLGGTGDDTLTVDLNGRNPVANVPITFDGGAGHDSLIVSGTPLAPIGASTYTPGSITGSGRLSEDAMNIDFQNLEPVLDTVVAGTLIVNGTNASNAIGYIQTPGNPAQGRVTVDGQEFIDFANKTNLTINGQGGDDTINLSNDSVPTGLTSITVNGGASGVGAGTDTLVVNGAVAAVDQLSLVPTGQGAGTVAHAIANPTVTFNNLAGVVLSGGVGGLTAMQVGGTAGNDQFEYIPGPTPDAGQVVGTMNQFVLPFALTPITFRNMTQVFGTFFNSIVPSQGGTDTFIYDGTPSNDVIGVSPNGVGSIGIFNTVAGTIFSSIGVASISGATVRGGAGSNTFTVSGVLVNVPLTVEGNASNTDILNYQGNGGAPVTLDLINHTITETGFSPVTYKGVGTVNINTFGQPLTVLGGAANDNLDVTETSATAGFLRLNGAGPLVNFSGVTAVNVDLLGGTDDVLTVSGTAQSEVYNITTAQVSIVGLFAVNQINSESLHVNGLDGNDTFNVTSGAIPISVDGGDPVGVLPGDTINVVGGGPMNFFAGPTKDSGGFQIGANAPVSFIHIETIGAINPGPGNPIIVQGTNGEDVITVIARDASYSPLADGIQDFTVSVNGGPDILYINAPLLYIDGLSGADDINVRAPAPNGAAWNVQLFIAGGPPAGGNGTETDQLIFETPGGDPVTFTPTGADTGTIVLQQATTSTITLGAFTVPALQYTSSPGGIDIFNYDGQAGNDNLTVVGTAGADLFTQTPGVNRDTGVLQVNSLLPVRYQNLGPTGALSINGLAGVNTLTYEGTQSNDLFGVSATGVVNMNSPTTGAFVPVNTANIQALVLDGLNGDDQFAISPSALFTSGITLNGGNPSGSDSATLTGTAGADAIVLNLIAAGDTVTGVVGGPVTLTSIENLTINSLAGSDNTTVNNAGAPSDLQNVTFTGAGAAVDIDTLTVNGLAGQNALFSYLPTGPTSGQFSALGGSTNFKFTLNPAAINAASATSNNIVQMNGSTLPGDAVTVFGSNNADYIAVNATGALVSAGAVNPTNPPLAARSVLVQNAASTTLQPVLLGATIDAANVQAQLGNDTILVIPARGTGGNDVVGPGFVLPSNLLVNVDGGAGGNDAIVVAGDNLGGALGANQFVVVNRNNAADGVVRVFQSNGVNQPIQYPDITYTNLEQISPIPSTSASPAIGPNLLILGPDTYEQDEFLQTAAFLGSGQTINATNLAIFPNAFEHRFVQPDADYYRIVANTTGTLDVRVFFRQIAGFLPGSGNLQLEVLDAAGNVIAGGAGNNASFGVNDVNAAGGERRRLPVVAGQTYYIHVFGNANTTTNAYSLQIINDPAPAPFNLELNDIVAQGSANLAGASTTGFTASNSPAPGVAPLSTVAGFYNNKIVTFTSGDLTGQSARITAYTRPGGVPTFALGSTLIGAPAAGTTFQIESDDSGRSQLDNVTRISTPTILLRLDDGNFVYDLPGNGAGNNPPIQTTAIPFNNSNVPFSSTAGYRVAIFDETDPQNPVPLGFATAVLNGASQPTGVYTFTFVTGLTDGSHFISAKVQMIDPATPVDSGFGPRSLSFEIVVDTGLPSIFFGVPTSALVPGSAVDGLDAGSDSGVNGQAATFSDNITNVTAPTFFGTAEANSIVRLYLDSNNNGVLDATDQLIAQTVATPIDGTNQAPNGRWVVKSNVTLADGSHTIFATAEDAAGNLSVAAQLVVNIDTRGPQVTGVTVPGFPNFNLFGLKPNALTPTPLVNSLDVTFTDPNHVPAFSGTAINPILAANTGNYSLVGDATGQVVISGATVVGTTFDNNGIPTTTVRLTFASPLPDDRFSFKISDNLADNVGNAMDGESQGGSPFDPNAALVFPSGDTRVGGGFSSRFTVDSRPELGTYAAGGIKIDINGNSLDDPQGETHDATNRDLTFTLPVLNADGSAVPAGTNFPTGFSVHDGLFAGNFAGPGVTADGFSKLAAYGNFNGVFRWLIDGNNDGAVTLGPGSQDYLTVQPAGYQIDGIPLAGDFDGLGKSVAAGGLGLGDQVALWDGSKLWIDRNRDHVIDAADGAPISEAIRGYPIVGDFDGDGKLDFATWKDDVFYFDMGNDGLGAGPIQTINFGFPGVGETPVAADMNADGITDIGLFVPGRSGTQPQNGAQWYFLQSNFATPAAGSIGALAHNFSPSPLGQDAYYQYGDSLALPIAGNFDPPATPKTTAASTATDLGILHAPKQLAGASGDQWYNFTPSRDGALGVNVTTGAKTGAVDAHVYDQNLNLLDSGSVSASGFVQLSQSVKAGQSYLLRVVGADSSVTVKISNTVSEFDRLDVSRDKAVTPLDAIQVINELNGNGARAVSLSGAQLYFDTNMDGAITPLDALLVINYLNAHTAAKSVVAATTTASSAKTVTVDTSAAALASMTKTSPVQSDSVSGATSAQSMSQIATDAVFGFSSTAATPAVDTSAQAVAVSMATKSTKKDTALQAALGDADWDWVNN